MKKRMAGVGMPVGIGVFFLGLLVSEQVRSGPGELLPAVLLYAAIAVPGGLATWWLAARPRG
ncbi:hypothetical protein [Streptomyces sp. NPDC089919]|uniref:hypothetical protein n=1 Tax=Streptomyces sp. NPDC089919 TaxID=3155188 RepID=UPI003445C627